MRPKKNIVILWGLFVYWADCTPLWGPRRDAYRQIVIDLGRLRFYPRKIV